MNQRYTVRQVYAVLKKLGHEINPSRIRDFARTNSTSGDSICETRLPALRSELGIYTNDDILREEFLAV